MNLISFRSLIFLALAFAGSFSIAAEEAAPSPVIVGYSYYKYDLHGTNTANTSIYGFANGTVDLHLTTATWLYSPQWTFIAFAPYIKNMVQTTYEPTPTGANLTLTDYTEGLGDLRLMAISPFWSSEGQALTYDVSVTLPTGNTDNYFTSSPKQRAAYNMQLGSGTPDLLLGTDYSFGYGNWTSTARGQLTLRGGTNSHGYALGNELVLNANQRYKFNSYFTLGAQLNYKARGRIEGKDEKYELFNNYTSATDPSISGDGHQFYHAHQITWDGSLVAKLQSPSWSRYSASLEGGLPLAQGAMNKDNIRFDTKYWFAASVMAIF